MAESLPQGQYDIDAGATPLALYYDLHRWSGNLLHSGRMHSLQPQLLLGDRVRPVLGEKIPGAGLHHVRAWMKACNPQDCEQQSAEQPNNRGRGNLDTQLWMISTVFGVVWCSSNRNLQFADIQRTWTSLQSRDRQLNTSSSSVIYV